MWPESAKPKTLVLGLGPVTTFFRVKTRDFAPFPLHILNLETILA